MPSHYDTRRNESCPDGYEHMMSNGTWMCGKDHQNNLKTPTRNKTISNSKQQNIITIDDDGKGVPNLSQVPEEYKRDVENLIDYYQNPGDYRWEIPKSCSGCGGGVGFNGCAGMCVDGKAKKDKWKFTLSWTFNQGGLLQGPTHSQGGIPAIVGGSTPIELEGGEYIVNAQTVNALGTPFLDELNSTQTSYHQGGYGAGQLPAPSQFKNGGRVVNKRKSTRTKPIPTRRVAAKKINSKNILKNGGAIKGPRKMSHGGMGHGCPQGTIMGANGRCISTMTSSGGSGGYRKGGKVINPRKKLQEGGLVTAGKATVMSNVKNKQQPTNFKSINSIMKGQTPSNVVGAKIRTTRGGPVGVKSHKHVILVDPTHHSGHTSTERGHSHKVVNGALSVECGNVELGCHSHQF